MKRLIEYLMLALLYCCLCSGMASDTIDFSGQWIPDSEKSDPYPVMRMKRMNTISLLSREGSGSPVVSSASGPWVIKHIGDTIHISNPNSKTPDNEYPYPDWKEEAGIIFGMPLASTVGVETKGITGLSFGVPGTEEYLLDWTERVEMIPVSGSGEKEKRTVRARLNRNKVQVREMMEGKQGKRRIDREFLLSDDRITLTLKISTITTLSGMVVPTELLTEQKLVFSKQ
jgi:hypothetical protein